MLCQVCFPFNKAVSSVNIIRGKRLGCLNKVLKIVGSNFDLDPHPLSTRKNRCPVGTLGDYGSMEINWLSTSSSLNKNKRGPSRQAILMHRADIWDSPLLLSGPPNQMIAEKFV